MKRCFYTNGEKQRAESCLNKRGLVRLSVVSEKMKQDDKFLMAIGPLCLED
ncbi:MAG: hypothetical protein AD073_000265 [Mycoplasmataceae bacterium]|nr:MAG: hypothetical protein AD073_000265 [Mycoplasmataceae bacterium]